MLETSPKTSRVYTLMAALRSYLSPDKYNHLVRKASFWEPESFWKKMKRELKTLQIPQDPDDERCITIYATLYNQSPEEIKQQMLSSSIPHSTAPFIRKLPL